MIPFFLSFRYRLLREGYKRFNKDGLNSLKYKLINIQLKPLYTKISVDIKESEVMKVYIHTIYTQ